MKKFIVISSLAVFVLFAEACNGGSKNPKADTGIQSASTNYYYTCSMHPEIRSDKPGKCPKCGMELIKKETVKIDSTKVQKHIDSTKVK